MGKPRTPGLGDVLEYVDKFYSYFAIIFEIAEVVTPNLRPNSARDKPYSVINSPAILRRITGNLPLRLPERNS
jgi:hypothetical protein